MFESYSWLGATVELFVATLALIAVVMLVIDIYREWQARHNESDRIMMVARWDKALAEQCKPKIGDYDPRKDVGNDPLYSHKTGD